MSSETIKLTSLQISQLIYHMDKDTYMCVYEDSNLIGFQSFDNESLIYPLEFAKICSTQKNSIYTKYAMVW
jgi:hypothetical protein